MITLKKVKQTADMCGPASLVSLLDFYGVHKSEHQLARLCRSTQKHGTPPHSIVSALQKLGFTVQARQGGTWVDLKKLIDKDTPVLVNWWSDYDPPAEGHYSVAYKITDASIYLMDPEIGDFRRMSKQKFLRNWYDFIGATNEPNRHWYLYLEKKSHEVRSV